VRLDHRVLVPVGTEDVWRFLNDVPAVARCLPGAELTDVVDDDTYHGSVKVSVGPLAMNYSGELKVAERDGHRHRMRIDASGRDRRGAGTASAAISLELEPEGDKTEIAVVSDVRLTGRMAALGRGVQDVSSRLFAEFAEEMANQLGGDTGRAHPPSQAAGGTAVPDHSGSGGGVRPGNATYPPAQPGHTDSIKLVPLVWSVTRQRIANFLQRLSDRIRP
jgi:carbon monoxide dehydrogenase subunit G